MYIYVKINNYKHICLNYLCKEYLEKKMKGNIQSILLLILTSLMTQFCIDIIDDPTQNI